ncbi:MAG TPA: FMN-binding protein, partial [Clostridiaceae bacterium]|nr:FMN-binding protein [Clostridiaceae bacterium]
MSPDKKNRNWNERGIMPVVILTIVALVSVLLLALTANLTQEARIKQDELMKSENQRLLFPDADAFELVELSAISADLPDVKKADLAKRGDETLGYVIEVSKGGYGGPLPVLTGVGSDGTIIGIQILDNGETAGIGKKVEDEAYRDQFVGQDFSEPVGVDTIGGATISSASVNASVKDALVAYGVLSGAGELPVKLDPKESIFADGIFTEADAAPYAEQKITAVWDVNDASGNPLGTIFESTVQGYGGDVPVLTGFDPEGSIVGVALGDNSETEGFGKRWEDPAMMEQFVGQSARDDLQIDMIAEVTVTSYAVKGGLDNAKAAFLLMSGEGSSEEPGEDIKNELFPGATFSALDVSQFDGIASAHKSDAGYVVAADAKGFGGDMTILVGYETDGAISGVLLESHNETPGYGMKAEEAEYRDQYIGQKAGDDITVDGITGATVTSEAFVDAVSRTAEVFAVIDTLPEATEDTEEPDKDDPKLALFPDAEFEDVDAADYEDDGITAIYQTEDGYVIDAAVKGYGGDISFSVGYTNDGEIVGLLIGEHSETPGLGAKIEDEAYKEQFVGLKADDIDVDGI